MINDPVAPAGAGGEPVAPAVEPATPATPAEPVVEPATPAGPVAATPAEPAPAEPAVPPVEGEDPISPESYSDFTLPEGVVLDEALLGKAAPIFKELNLTQEQAQKLVDLQAEMVQEGARSQSESFNQLIEGWQNESKNDKEFGGEQFDENVATAKLAIDKFGTPELKQLMEDHGVGNHPEMIRFMWNIGKLMKEDVPGGFSAASSEKKDRTEIMYPKS